MSHIFSTLETYLESTSLVSAGNIIPAFHEVSQEFFRKDVTRVQLWRATDGARSWRRATFAAQRTLKYRTKVSKQDQTEAFIRQR